MTLVWSGCFESHSDAVAAAGETSSLFGNRHWLQRQGALREAIVPKPLGFIDTINPRPTLLPLLVAGKRAVSAVDFGGGSGWVLDACRQADAQFDLYTVIEVKPVVRTFGPLGDGVLSFRTGDDLTGIDPCDVLYCNSTLQYLPNNRGFLAVVEACRPKMVLLDELLWTWGEMDWFTVQVNSDNRVVARFVAVDALVEELRDLGLVIQWSMLLRGNHRQAFPDMHNLPADKRIEGRLSMLFAREGHTYS